MYDCYNHMSLGTHEASVNEAVELFRGIASSTIFPTASSPDILSIEEAIQAAWEDLHGEEQLTWSDIRSVEMRAVWNAAYYASKEFKEIESALKEIINDLTEELAKRFRGSRVEVIGEDVIQDMQNSVYARAVLGPSSPFFERLIRLYKDGIWPCGWEGYFPEGNIRGFAIRPTSA